MSLTPPRPAPLSAERIVPFLATPACSLGGSVGEGWHTIPVLGVMASFLRAARRGDVGTLVRLLPAADLECATQSGSTPLILAARHGNLEALRVLIRAGANVEARNAGGNTPLGAAAGFGHVDCVLALLAEGGAEIDAVDNRSCTALIKAVRFGRIEVVAALLAYAPDLSIRDRDGQSATEIARASEDGAIAHILESHATSGAGPPPPPARLLGEAWLDELSHQLETGERDDGVMGDDGVTGDDAEEVASQGSEDDARSGRTVPDQEVPVLEQGLHGPEQGFQVAAAAALHLATNSGRANRRNISEEDEVAALRQRIARLEAQERAPGDENRENGETVDMLCPICYERGRDHALVPCGHLICGVCLRRIRSGRQRRSRPRCPFCRGRITSQLRLHI